jgi:dihydrodipicolinate synthase/N-acetylneuraminate lyase
VPFEEDYSVDEDSFRRLLRWAAERHSARGVLVNADAGEVDALLIDERAEVVWIAVDELGESALVVSGVRAEGTIEAGLNARAAEDAGADGILLLPPHSWGVRGRADGAAEAYAAGVAAEVRIPVLAANALDVVDVLTGERADAGWAAELAQTKARLAADGVIATGLPRPPLQPADAVPGGGSWSRALAQR